MPLLFFETGSALYPSHPEATADLYRICNPLAPWGVCWDLRSWKGELSVAKEAEESTVRSWDPGQGRGVSLRTPVLNPTCWCFTRIRPLSTNSVLMGKFLHLKSDPPTLWFPCDWASYQSFGCLICKRWGRTVRTGPKRLSSSNSIISQHFKNKSYSSNSCLWQLFVMMNIFSARTSVITMVQFMSLAPKAN